ncbi:MAG: winged helix-turn-helix transcriptional regulator [Patescibacteria group bacterium]
MTDEAPIPKPIVPESAQEAPAPVETPTPAPTEPTAPETAASAQNSVEPTQTAQPETQTAQMGRSEPLPTPSEPLPDQQPASQPSAPTQVTAPIAHRGRDVLTKARATIQDRKRKKLDKILEALTVKGKVTNDEVEKLLHVSDATATRYLSALEKEGKIQQVGKTGKAVEYTRI